MKITLNGWQRMWIVASALMLIPTLFFMVAFWPYPESAVLKELNSPACKIWRDMPDGYVPDEYPSYDSDCYELRSLLFRKITLRSVADYEEHLTQMRVREVVYMLGAWIGLILTIYAVGWSVGWITKGFHKKPT